MIAVADIMHYLQPLWTVSSIFKQSEARFSPFQHIQFSNILGKTSGDFCVDNDDNRQIRLITYPLVYADRVKIMHCVTHGICDQRQQAFTAGFYTGFFIRGWKLQHAVIYSLRVWEHAPPVKILVHKQNNGDFSRGGGEMESQSVGISHPPPPPNKSLNSIHQTLYLIELKRSTWNTQTPAAKRLFRENTTSLSSTGITPPGCLLKYSSYR